MIIRFFYNSSKSLFAKILFGAIILSFGLWGLGDIVRSYMASKTVIQVGNYKIPSDQFRYQYSRKKQNLRNKNGNPLTAEEMKRSETKNIILDLITEEVVEKETVRQLGIVVSRESLAQTIHSLPEFQTNGIFDDRLYVSTLQQSGISEAELLHQVRDSISRNQLFHPIISGYRIPDFVREALGTVYETNKTIWVAKIDANKTKIDDAMDDNTLRQYYQNNADKYKKPELRDIAIMKIDYTKFIDEIKITDEEVEIYFNEHKDMLQLSETRDFDRLEFDTKEEADTTLRKLAKGNATEIRTNSQTLTNMKKSEFPSYIATDIFGLAINHFSNIYSIGGKFYVYKLIKINKPKQKDKQAMLNEARNALRADKINSPEFYSTIRDIKNKIEDEFASGIDVDNIAKNLKVELIEIPSYNKRQDDKRIKDIVADNEVFKGILEYAKSLQERQASPIVESKDNENISYVVWIRNIKKEFLPPFEQVKNTVLKDYETEIKNKETVTILNELIGESTDPIKQIKEFPEAKSYTICKKDLILDSDNKDMKRLKNDCQYPGTITEVLSVLKPNKCKYYKLDNNTYLVIGLEKNDIVKKPSNTIKFVIKQFLGRTINSDIYQIARFEFKDRQKIKIHEKVLKDITERSDITDGEL